MTISSWEQTVNFGYQGTKCMCFAEQNNTSSFTCKVEIQVPIQQFHDYSLIRQPSASI